MRAAVMRGGKLVVDEVDEPKPGPGQVLVETLACGICGSDLHFLKYGPSAVVGDAPFDPSQDLVMGHEFSARVIERGAGVENVEVGDVVVSMPVMVTGDGMAAIGYSNDYPGGYSDRMVLFSPLCLKVPEGLSPEHAALTEPLAVGRHAANAGGITKDEGAIVLGCGPIGLAIISALALDGVEPIIAADYSRKRRELAGAIGAHEVVDPKDEPAIEAWTRVAGARVPVTFEAVGVPGMLERAMEMAPRSSRIIVAGVCMEPDTIQPLVGIRNELTLRFVLGYTPDEFSVTLQTIAAGKVPVEKLITTTVNLDEVPQAFDMLAQPDEHVKILVTPNGG